MLRFREKLFPALAGALWVLFLLLDLTGAANSTGVKFAGICLCCLAAWTGCRSRDGLLVAAALSLTVCADVFLLVLNRGVGDQLAGVRLFLPVQLLYAFRLYRLRGNKVCPWGAALRLLGILSAPGPALGPRGRLYALTAVYFLNLLVNALEAWQHKRTSPGDPLPARFALGLLLFLGCDLCVGCWNLGLLGDFARVGMWFFYLPSQVLIVLSQQIDAADP